MDWVRVGLHRASGIRQRAMGSDRVGHAVPKGRFLYTRKIPPTLPTRARATRGQYSSHFNAKQRAKIVSAAGASSGARLKKPANQHEVAPKYWLAHTQETWSGRGRPPRARHAIGRRPGRNAAALGRDVQ